MNEEQPEKFIDFLLPNGDLKSREELREILKDKTTDEINRYLPLENGKEY